MIEPAPCPSCGAPIPGVVVNAPFCPYCGKPKGHLQHGSAAVAMPVAAQVQAQALPLAISVQGPNALQIQVIARADRKARPAKIFSTHPRDLCLTFDPRAGYAVVGSHTPEGQPARLQSYNLHEKRVTWEALANEPAMAAVEYEHLAVHNGNIYVSLERKMRVVESISGKPRWGCELPDTIKYESDYDAWRGAKILDPAPPGARGPIWVITSDDVISAFDRDSGQPLFHETRENMPRKIRPFEGGLLLLESREFVEIVDAATRKPFDRVDGRIERVEIEGHLGLLQVRRFGWRERDGILLHDFFAKKEVLFEAIENIEDDVQTVTGHNRVFCTTESGAKLVAAPHPAPKELVPGFHIVSLVMCGPTLMALLAKAHGTRIRRLVGVDPQTLNIRFDLGELTTEPSDHWTTQMCSNGFLTVVVGSVANDDDKCELMGIDPGGRVLWTIPIGEWRGHYFLGGNIAVVSADGFRVVRPDNGQLVGEHTQSDGFDLDDD